MTRQVKALAAAALATAIVATGTAAADGGKEQIKFNAVDQAAARAVVIRRSDLGSSSGWTGGATKPDLSAGPTCANYHPKQSDLVLTGAAEADFRNGEVEFDSKVQVLRTARMVQLDWQRGVQAPSAVPCVRSYLAKSLGSTSKLVSFSKLSIPQVATYTAAFRVLFDVHANGKTTHLAAELLLVSKGRTEITLSSFFPAAAQASVEAATLRLARVLLGRAARA